MGDNAVMTRSGRSAKKKKVGTLVSAFIEKQAYDALLTHCDRTGQSKTKAIERAILMYCGQEDDAGTDSE